MPKHRQIYVKRTSDVVAELWVLKGAVRVLGRRQPHRVVEHQLRKERHKPAEYSFSKTQSV